MAEGELKADSDPRDIQDVVSTRSSPALSLKRSPSPTCEDQDSRKRLRKSEEPTDIQPTNNSGMESKLVEDIAQELECGCCSELLYRPVMVSPCQHVFCGSCCLLWIRNGGTNCPACRTVATIASPSRPLQLIIDALLRNAPQRTRTVREREQADEIYKIGTVMRFPSPREASPEPNVNISAEFARPCPHCSPNNVYGWSCPVPIPDPTVDLDRAWHIDDGLPTGHVQCGNCENYTALRAPSTSRCDFCKTYFCGIGVPSRCSAAPITLQQPQGFTDISDIIQSSDIYECFNSNTVEVDIMLDYITEQRYSPRNIYRDIVKHILEQPGQFQPLIASELFTIAHSGPSVEPESSDPPHKICRLCACEIFIWGIKDWWIRERRKAFVDKILMQRKDCPEGSACAMQSEFDHAREFNHIIDGKPVEMGTPAEPEPSKDSSVPATQVNTTESDQTSSTAEILAIIASEAEPMVE
ncbi:hypothetical protein F5878DRAFT_359975 [Lentinula raphanica]|uniref:RING-type domain-containing protein n=1 Tax=Lentinula raphanica TaxID=153919 RepID=A0AA38UIN8_9AGAR|nr:hypothetical protein F5878DRAFT_359975 [Lentinula raphanica]